MIKEFIDAVTKPFRASPTVDDAKKGIAIAPGEVMRADPYHLFGGREKAITVYNPDSLINRKGLEIIDKMRRDDQVKICMSFKKTAALSSGWTIYSPPGKPDDWEVTQFVKESLDKIEGGLHFVLKSILVGLDYGYSVSEKVFANDGRNIIISAIKTRSPYGMQFGIDEFGTLGYLEQDGNKFDNLDKFIVYTNNMEFGNWYGRSDITEAYRPWWSKDNAYKWLAMLLEKNGIPPVFVLYDQDVYQGTTLTRLQNIVKNMQAATTATLPRSGKDSIEFWAPEIANNVQNVFIPALNMFNTDIAKALLTPGLIGATSDSKEGSLARSRVHFDMFILSIEEIRTFLATNIVQKQIIKQLVDLNFAVDEYPKFEFLTIEDDVRLDILKQWCELTTDKVVTPQDDDEIHIRDMLDFPPLSADTIAEKKKQKEADDKMKETLANGNDDSSSNGASDAGMGNNKPDSITEATGNGAGVKGFSIKEKRQKTAHEKKINFSAINAETRRLETDFIEVLSQVVRDEMAMLLNKVKKDSADYATLNVRSTFKTRVFDVLKELLLSASEYGYAEVEALSKKNFAVASSKKPKVGYLASHADKWLTTHARNIAGILSDRLEHGVTIILSNAIKNGTTLGDIIEQIQDLFLPYIGNDNIIEDDEVISPHRIETIVRTNTTQAINQGRLVAMRDPDIALFMAGVQYSAILDERTTDVCEHLDGKVFNIDDSDLDRLTPPNHFNCRSVLVPVMVDEKINANDFITQAEKGAALDKAGKDFV